MEHADIQRNDWCRGFIIGFYACLACAAGRGQKDKCAQLFEEAEKHMVNLCDLNLDMAINEARKYGHIDTEMFLISVITKLGK
jgi:hypothetical protein